MSLVVVDHSAVAKCHNNRKRLLKRISERNEKAIMNRRVQNPHMVNKSALLHCHCCHADLARAAKPGVTSRPSRARTKHVSCQTPLQSPYVSMLVGAQRGKTAREKKRKKKRKHVARGSSFYFFNTDKRKCCRH